MSITDVGGSSGDPRPSGSENTGSPKDLAAAAARTVKQEAASFASSAQEKATDKISATTQTATETLGDFASAIRKAGEDLAQNDQSLAGKVVKQAADGLESFSRSVSDKRPEELLDAVRDFGRNNPAAFIAGSVLLGIAIGRLAKSTEQRSSGGTTSPPSYRDPTDYLAASESPVQAGGEAFDPALSRPATDYGTGV
jgi:hypothetical protein